MLGGFVDYGEDPEVAVVRELKEETHLDGCNPQLVAVRGNPKRDPRQHIVTIAYCVQVTDTSNMHGDDDAAEAKWIELDRVCQGTSIAFDHQDLAVQFRDWLALSGKL